MKPRLDHYATVQRIQALQPADFAEFDWEGAPWAELQSKLAPLADPEFRFVPVNPELLERPPAPGLEGYRQIMRDWSASWESWTRTTEEIVPAGDRVFVAARHVFRSHESKREIVWHAGEVWSFRGDKILAIVIHTDIDQARADAGLSKADA